jgi:hypothetical protein
MLSPGPNSPNVKNKPSIIRIQMISSTGEREWESTHDDETADILGKTFVKTRHDEPENSLEKNADGERVFWTEIVCYVGPCTSSGEIKQ